MIMDFEKKVNEVLARISKGKEINREMAIRDLGIDSLDLVEAITDIEELLNPYQKSNYIYLNNQSKEPYNYTYN